MCPRVNKLEKKMRPIPLGSVTDLHDVDPGPGKLDLRVVLPLDGRVPHLPRLLDQLVLSDRRVRDVVVQSVALLLEGLQLRLRLGQLEKMNSLLYHPALK